KVYQNGAKSTGNTYLVKTLIKNNFLRNNKRIRFLPNSVEKSRDRFDFVRSLLSILATVAIVYALHEAPSLGWDAPLVLVSLIMGITGVVGFILWEIKHNAPLLDIKLFRERGLTSGSVSLLTVFWR